MGKGSGGGGRFSRRGVKITGKGNFREVSIGKMTAYLSQGTFGKMSGRWQASFRPSPKSNNITSLSSSNRKAIEDWAISALRDYGAGS